MKGRDRISWECDISYEGIENGRRYERPAHEYTRDWRLPIGYKYEVMLAYAMARVAKKNGIRKKELKPLFNLIMRMLKSKLYVKW